VSVDGLELRTSPTARVPQCKNLHFVTADSVITIVVNSSEMDAPHFLCLGVQHQDPNSRLRAEERKRFRELFIQGDGSKRSILLPPSSSSLNVRVGSLGDPNSHGLISGDGGQVSQAPLRPRSSRHDRPRR
jgi:hypothetical protein